MNLSVYLNEDIDTIATYLNRFPKEAVDYVFISFQYGVSIESNEDKIYFFNKMKAISKLCHSLAMKIIVDISPDTLTIFKEDDIFSFLEKVAIDVIRIDYGFDDQMIRALSKKYIIALNASTLNQQKITALGIEASRLIACHNFYPKNGSGLPESLFITKNLELQHLGISVAAFIPGDENLRGPLYEGLPTIEKQRATGLINNYLEMKNRYYVNAIFVGDMGIKPETISQIESLQRNEITCRMRINQKILPVVQQLLDQPLQTRSDCSACYIRSSETRNYFKNSVISSEHNDLRVRGSVTIDNEKYGRYQGEINIMLVDMPADSRTNVIGKIDEKDLEQLELMASGTTIKFEKE